MNGLKSVIKTAVFAAVLLAGFSLAHSVSAAYFKEGSLVSTNMLNGLTNVGAITQFTATTTITASTTVSVQFSRNKITWYNHSGTAFAQDSLSNGSNSISLSALNWSGPIFYYKLILTTAASSTTPTVTGAAVNYNASGGPTYSYFGQGSLVSVNMLSGLANVGAITGFNATTTLPSGTAATVQFSRDQINWYNHAGTAFTSDSLANGPNIIDLSALNWSGPLIYYKLNLTSGDPGQTPTVSGVQFNYSFGSGLTYFKQGTLVSNNLLAGTSSPFSATGQRFGYNITSMPSGTSVQAQFSKDGTNFYSATGTAWGWTALSPGNNMAAYSSLDLSGLGWATSTSFYYKLQLNSSDSGQTPLIRNVGILPDYTVTSTSKSFSAPNIAGSLIVVGVYSNTTGRTITVSDSNGNAYNLAASATQTADGHQIAVFYAMNVNAGANTVTASISGAATSMLDMTIHEYGSMARTNALDQVAVSTGGSNPNLNTPNLPATSQSVELLYSFNGLSDTGTSTSVTAGSGYTARKTVLDGGYVRAFDQDRIVTTVGSYNATATANSGNNWSSILVAFKAGNSSGASSGLMVANNLTTGGLGGSGSPIVDANTNNVALTVGGNIVIGNTGIFSAASTSPFIISGNFTNNGIFTHNYGTVTFNTSATSTINGSATTTFYNISVNTPGKVLQFKAGQVTTITNLFTVTGSSTQANFVTIESDTLGSQWKAHFTVAQSSFQYIIIKDSGCDSGTAAASLNGSAIDAGGNDYACWKFITPRVDLSLVNNVTGGSGGGVQQSGGSAGGGGNGNGAALVQSNSINCTTTGNCSVTISPTAAGDFLVVLIEVQDNSGGSLTSVTDNKSSTYSPSWNVANIGTHYNAAIYYTANTASGITSVTIHPAGTGLNSNFIVAEYSGVLTASPYDVGSDPTNNVLGNSPYASATVTPTQATELLIGYVLNINGISTYTGTNGWTAVASQVNSSGSSIGFQQQMVTTLTGYANTGTTSQGSGNWAGIATFKAIVSGSDSQGTGGGSGGGGQQSGGGGGGGGGGGASP